MPLSVVNDQNSIFNAIKNYAFSPDGDKVTLGLAEGNLGGKRVSVVKSGGSRIAGNGIREALLTSFKTANITDAAKTEIRHILLGGAKNLQELHRKNITGADVRKIFDIASKGFLGGSQPKVAQSPKSIQSRAIKQVAAQTVSPQDLKTATSLVKYLATKRYVRSDGKTMLSPLDQKSLTKILSSSGGIMEKFRQLDRANDRQGTNDMFDKMMPMITARSLYSNMRFPPLSRSTAKNMMLMDMTDRAGKMFGLTKAEKSKVWNALNKDYNLSKSKNPADVQASKGYLRNWMPQCKLGKEKGLLAIVVNATLGNGRATKGVLANAANKVPPQSGKKATQQPTKSSGATKAFFDKAFGTAPGAFMKDAVIVEGEKKSLFDKAFGKAKAPSKVADGFEILDEIDKAMIQADMVYEDAQKLTAQYLKDGLV